MSEQELQEKTFRPVPFEPVSVETPTPKVKPKEKDFPFRKYFMGGQKADPAPFKPDWKNWKNDEMTFAWLGHATVLINFFGTWILTDPVLGERCGIKPLGLITIGPRRLVDAPLSPEELPRIDLLLLSHAHMDHTDTPSLKKMRNAKHAVVAVNTLDIYRPLRIADCRELEWGDTIEYPDLGGVTVESIQVKHFGWRYPWEPCRSRNENRGRSYNAYLVEKRDPSGKLRSFVFGGDTAYTDTFLKIGERMRLVNRQIDIALMPIGAYNPWVGAHCNPEQSWNMTKDMNAKAILPLHWNTFVQSSEPRFEPIEWLQSVVDRPQQIVLSQAGETWSSR